MMREMAGKLERKKNFFEEEERRKKRNRRERERMKCLFNERRERSFFFVLFFLASSYSMQSKIAAHCNSKAKIFSYIFIIVEPFLYLVKLK